MKMIMQKEKTLININVYLITSLEQCKLNSMGRGNWGILLKRMQAIEGI